MVNPNNGRPVRFAGAIAAIIVAIEGAILLARKAGQAIVNLPKEVVDLISAIAQGVGATLEKLDSITDAIKNISIQVSTGFPPNADGITSVFVPCTLAQPNTYQLPSIPVPQDCMVVLLGRNPAGANTGIIYVSGTQVGAGTNTSAYPLIPNATVGYKVKNANSIWIGSTVAGEGVYITVEQMKG